MKNKSAFTLIETIIAITLITLVLTAVTGLILTTLLANERNTRTLQANFLAQEGLEAVRYMRDSNWLQNYSWDGGKEDWQQDFHVTEMDTSLELFLKPTMCSELTLCFQLSGIPEDGIVTLNNNFEFNRTLTFDAIYNEGVFLNDAVQVTATVSWLEHGISRSSSLYTILTDWK